VGCDTDCGVVTPMTPAGGGVRRLFVGNGGPGQGSESEGRGYGLGVPTRGTAGLARFLVSGYRRVPAPPPRMTPSTLCCVGGLRQISSWMDVGATLPSTALVVCFNSSVVGFHRQSWWSGTEVQRSLSEICAHSQGVADLGGARWCVCVCARSARSERE